MIDERARSYEVLSTQGPSGPARAAFGRLPQRLQSRTFPADRGHLSRQVDNRSMHQTISSVTLAAVAANAPDRCDTSATLRHHPLTSQVNPDVSRFLPDASHLMRHNRVNPALGPAYFVAGPSNAPLYCTVLLQISTSFSCASVCDSEGPVHRGSYRRGSVLRKARGQLGNRSIKQRLPDVES